MTSLDPAFGAVTASTTGSDKASFDPAKVCKQIVRHQTSIVVLGNVSERTDVFSLVREIRSRQPKVRCVFLSSDVRRSSISAAFQCGASGFFAKGDDLRDILNGLRQIAVCNNDEFVLGQKVMAQCRMWGAKVCASGSFSAQAALKLVLSDSLNLSSSMMGEECEQRLR
jgi:CheY-like chemotaxis protein